MNRLAGSVDVEITTEQDANTMLEDFRKDLIASLQLKDRTEQSEGYRVSLIFEAERAS